MSLSAPDSEVDICNLALSQLKQDLIAQIDPPKTGVEQQCALWYHQIRQATLRSHTWNFAMKRVQLTPDASAVPAFGFSHAYKLPVDWVRYVNRYDGTGTPIGCDGDYDIEGRYYLFNGEDNAAINLRYVSDFQVVIHMDPLFRQLFALNLAITIAPRFSGSEARVGTLLEILKDLKTEATAIDGQERPPRRVQTSKFLDARRRGSRLGGAGKFIGG